MRRNLWNVKLPKKIVLIGAGGHAGVILDLIETLQKLEKKDIQVELLDDGIPDGTLIYNCVVAGKIDKCMTYSDDTGFLIGIGSNKTRRAIAENYCLNYITLVHPSAVIGRNVKLGEGTVVMAGAVINCETQIGTHCIVNTGATIDHECILEDYVHVSPGTNLGGRVTVGKESWIGIGSCVKNGVSICENVVIGAGATVIKTINQSGIYVGTPVRKI